MIKSRTKDDIRKLSDNHRNNRQLSIETDAVFVTRKHLAMFVRSLPQECDALKIMFIRHQTPPQDPRIKSVGNNLTQLSLIFVPLKDTNNSTWVGTTITDQNDKVLTLCFCEPGEIDRPERDSTGHCPPASGCPGDI